LVLDVFPGMSRAEATGGQEKYPWETSLARSVAVAA
jgi:hypothetical protein